MVNVIAVDVGTTSVRLAIISFTGNLLNEVHVLDSQEKDIQHSQDGSRFEQKSNEIWDSICECSRKCFSNSKIRPESIKSIAFSATCSLVIVGEHTGTNNDVIMWLDHRAIDEALGISSSGSSVLKQFGGICSPEFTLSKLKWLKNKDPATFANATGFFELPDWLVYKCLSSNSSISPETCPRSLCCVTCKWGYDVENNCHCDIVQSLDPEIKSKIGQIVLSPGSVAGYLSKASAIELGLIPEIETIDAQDKENLTPETDKDNIKVAVTCSLIDAHSGMLAMLSVPLQNQSCQTSMDIESTFCSLAGTSSCHMLLSRQLNSVPGIWGPYKDVVLEGFYLLEAGQSLTGKLIQICIESHEEGKMRIRAGEKLYDIIDSLNKKIKASSLKESPMHVLPSFHGNRSPLANPRLRGGIYGLSAVGERSLLEHYVATVESLAYEMKFIVETLNTKLDNLRVSGGLMKNSFYMQTLADVLSCPVVKMSLENIDFMVMGSGLVARHAAISSLGKEQSQRSDDSGRFFHIDTPMTEDSIRNLKYRQLYSDTYLPNTDQCNYHQKKYLCYREFVELSKRIDKILH